MFESKLNILVAYPYLKKGIINNLIENKESTRFLLDSGAFTAWKSGKEIQLDDYCKMLEKLPVTPWRYFTLDKIGDPKGSLENYETMLKRGFNPIPIFTRGEDPSVLEDYYKTSDVVGIGGLVKTSGNLGYVKGIMKYVGKRKVHWLGFVRHNFVNHYKPYMCDSSSWLHACRNGDLKVYIGKGEVKTVRKSHLISKPTKQMLEIFASYGISISDLRNESNWKNPKWLSSTAARMWIRRSIESEKKIGTHLFLSVALNHDLNQIYEGYKKEVKI